MSSIKGTYVLLTGGSRGIGPVIAKALAREGAHVALAARSEEGLRSVAQGLTQFGVQVLTFSVDLLRLEERQRLVSAVLEKFGRIDILVNNAGVEMEGEYASLSWEEIRQTVEVNLVAPMSLTHLVLPHMLQRRSGHIVNIASTAGKCGAPYAATYSATKAGLAEWTQGLRLELADSEVKMSLIYPGYVTEVGMFSKFGVDPPLTIGFCTPEQVAQAVVKAIKHNSLDVIINSVPIRPMLALRELFPSFGDWVLQKLGVANFQRRKVGLWKERS